MKLNSTLLLKLLAMLLLAPSLHAQTFIWNGSVNNSFSDPGNWANSMGGGQPTFPLEYSNGLASFVLPSGSPNCDIDVNIDVLKLEVQSGYSNNLTQVGAVQMDIGADGFLFGDGDFFGGSGDITLAIGTGLICSGGNFNSTSGRLKVVDSPFQFTGTGGFTDNNGEVFLERDVDITGVMTFHDLRLHATLDGSATDPSDFTVVSANIRVENLFTLSGTKKYQLRGNNIVVIGDVSLINTNSLSQFGLVNTSATIIFADNRNQVITRSAAAYSPLPNVMINKTGGTLTFPSELNVIYGWDYQENGLGNYLIPSNGTVRYIIANNIPITGDDPQLDNVEIYSNSAPSNTTIDPAWDCLLNINDPQFTVNGNMSIVSGNNTNSSYPYDLIGGRYDIYGDLTISSQFSIYSAFTQSSMTSRLAMVGGGNQTVTGTSNSQFGAIPILEVSKNAGTVNFVGHINLLRSFEFFDPNGVDPINAGASTLTFYQVPLNLNLFQVVGDPVTLNNVFHYCANTVPGTFDYLNTTTTIIGDLSFSNANPSASQGSFLLNTGDIVFQGVDINLFNQSVYNGALGGTANLIIEGPGNGPVSMHAPNGKGDSRLPNVEIDCAQNVVLDGIVAIEGDITFTNGNIISGSIDETCPGDPINLLVMHANSDPIGPNSSSYVDGAVNKLSNAGFIFPTGKNGSYRPIEVGPVGDDIIAEYFDAVLNGTSLGTGIVSVSNCEHWVLCQSNSSSLPQVTLHQDPANTCNINASCGLRVARLDLSGTPTWEDEGNGGTTATTVTSAGTVGAFGAFTFANALDVTFTAVVTDESCNPGMDGTITVTASGGQFPYSYRLDNGPWQNLNQFTGLSAGSYLVTVADFQGCSDTMTVRVGLEQCCDAATDTAYVELPGGTLTGNTYWPNKVYLSGNLIVPAGITLDITNTDVAMDNDISITLQGDAVLRAHNSTFRPCDPAGTWIGIRFEDQSSGSLHENVFVQAEIAVQTTTSGQVELSNNQFVNNEVAVELAAGTQGSALHSVTGNTFLLNSNNPFSGANNGVFTALMVDGLEVNGMVSQNKFVYAPTQSSTDEYFGIRVDDGAVIASENTFTNVHYPILLENLQLENRIEHNEIDFNEAFIGRNPTQSTLAAITLDQCESVVLISGNEINYSKGDAHDYDDYIGVYAFQAEDLVLYRNSVSDFETAFHLIETEGLVSSNELINNQSGINVEDTDNLSITDNEVSGASGYGIRVANSYSGIEVSNNVVHMVSGQNNSCGIRYYSNTTGTVSNVSILKNCVFDADFALQIRNAGSTCHLLPEIKGNYLYNYNTGLQISDFQGSVGSCTGTASDWGRNSFIGNDAAALDVEVLNSTLCNSSVVTLSVNWPGPPLSIAGDVQVQNGNCAAASSTAACGRQAGKKHLTATEVLAAYLAGKTSSSKQIVGNDREWIVYPYRPLPVEEFGSFGLTPHSTDQQVELEAWPNPVSSELTLRWIAPVAGNAIITLYDLQGKIVGQEKVSADQGSMQMDVSQLPSGMYLLRMTSSDFESKSLKIIRE